MEIETREQQQERTFDLMRLLIFLSRIDLEHIWKEKVLEETDTEDLGRNIKKRRLFKSLGGGKSLR